MGTLIFNIDFLNLPSRTIVGRIWRAGLIWRWYKSLPGCILLSPECRDTIGPGPEGSQPGKRISGAGGRVGRTLTVS